MAPRIFRPRAALEKRRSTAREPQILRQLTSASRSDENLTEDKFDASERMSCCSSGRLGDPRAWLVGAKFHRGDRRQRDGRVRGGDHGRARYNYGLRNRRAGKAAL